MTRDKAPWTGYVLLAAVLAIALAGCAAAWRRLAAPPSPRMSCFLTPDLGFMPLNLLKFWPILKPSRPRR